MALKTKTSVGFSHAPVITVAYSIVWHFKYRAHLVSGIPLSANTQNCFLYLHASLVNCNHFFLSLAFDDMTALKLK